MYAFKLIKLFSYSISVFLICQPTYSQVYTNDTVQQAYQDIVGMWISAEEDNSKWAVKENHIKTYYENELENTYTYQISIGKIHCGYDMSKRLEKYPWESILILTNIHTNKKKCYHVYGLDQKVLSIRPFGNSTFVSFEKQ